MITSLKKLILIIFVSWIISFLTAVIFSYKSHYFNSIKTILNSTPPALRIDTSDYEIPTRHAWTLEQMGFLSHDPVKLEFFDYSKIKRYEWKSFAEEYGFYPDILSRNIIQKISWMLYRANNASDASNAKLYYNQSEIDLQLDAATKSSDSPPSFHIFSPIDAHKHALIYYDNSEALLKNSYSLINYVSPFLNQKGAVFSLPQIVFGHLKRGIGYQTFSVNQLQASIPLEAKETLIASLPMNMAPSKWSAATLTVSASKRVYLGVALRYDQFCSITETYAMELYLPEASDKRTIFFNRTDIMNERHANCNITEVTLSVFSPEKQTVTASHAGFIKI